jgi:hypothetical protein
MKLLGGKWSRGDFLALLGVIAAILAIPGMPRLFHWDSETSSKQVETPGTATTPKMLTPAPGEPRAEGIPKQSDKVKSPLVKTATTPTWEQVRTDLAHNYVDVNVKGIVQFGAPECEVKPDAEYCRQSAHVTLQSADLTQRCYSVVAGYKLVKNAWRLEGVQVAGTGC